MPALLSDNQPLDLTEAQLARYEHDGYLVIPGFFTVNVANQLLARAHTLLDELDVATHPMTVFGTEKDKHIGDDYFLTSGDKVRYFFEPDAVDPTTGGLNRPKTAAVNKIGHALHSHDPLFSQFTLESERVKSVVRSIQSFRDPRVIQSMLILKQPRIGAPVYTHCDSTFLHTKPVSAVGLWFALEECTPSNGCLSFLPGSHKRNAVPDRLVRLATGGTGMEPSGNAVVQTAVDWDAEAGWVIEPCAAGDLVLIHGSVIHRSGKNLSDCSRFIYTFHVIEGAAVWDDKNWLQVGEGKEFDRLLI